MLGTWAVGKKMGRTCMLDRLQKVNSFPGLAHKPSHQGGRDADGLRSAEFLFFTFLIFFLSFSAWSARRVLRVKAGLECYCAAERSLGQADSFISFF